MSNGFSDIRLYKVCGANCYRTCACQHELNCILGTHDAAHADDGDMHSLRHLVNQAHCYRTYSRTAKTAGYIAEHRTLTLNINLGTEQRVNHGNCIRTCCFYSLSHHHNISYVRRKLGDNHFAGVGLNSTYNLSSCFRHSAENNTALFDVRTGDVDFYCINTVYIQLFGNSAVFLWGMAVDVDNHRYVIFFQLRQSVLQEVLAAGVFQTDAVQHTGRGFYRTLALIACCRLQRCTLYSNSANLFQVEKIGKFQTKAKGAGAGSNRSSHLHTGNINCQTAIIQCFYHSPTSSAQNTGPSLQTLMRLPMPSQAQDRHAPRPQAMYFSRDT